MVDLGDEVKALNEALKMACIELSRLSRVIKEKDAKIRELEDKLVCAHVDSVAQGCTH